MMKIKESSAVLYLKNRLPAWNRICFRRAIVKD